MFKYRWIKSRKGYVFIQNTSHRNGDRTDRVRSESDGVESEGERSGVSLGRPQTERT